MTEANGTVIIRGRYLFDAEGGEQRGGASVWVRGDRITGVYGRESPPEPPGAIVLDFPTGCILPGLMNSHVHLMYGTEDRMRGPKGYDHVNEADSDELMLLRAVRNGYRHSMLAGVTTMKDAGCAGQHHLRPQGRDKRRAVQGVPNGPRLGPKYHDDRGPLSLLRRRGRRGRGLPPGRPEADQDRAA